VTDRQTDGRTGRITTPKTALSIARAVKVVKSPSQNQSSQLNVVHENQNILFCSISSQSHFILRLANSQLIQPRAQPNRSCDLATDCWSYLLACQYLETPSHICNLMEYTTSLLRLLLSSKKKCKFSVTQHNDVLHNNIVMSPLLTFTIYGRPM